MEQSLRQANTEDLVNHVRRQANIVTHRLARYSLATGSQCEWAVTTPLPIQNFIVDLLVKDCM